jgi:hypothetical protein
MENRRIFAEKEQFAREKRAPLRHSLCCILVICILLLIIAKNLVEWALALIALVLLDEVFR